MTWLTPLLAAIAAGVAIPSLLILYFLKLRRRDLEVSTTLLWRKSIEDLQANAPFQKLRKNILLLLQLLILAAALFAVAQPQISGEITEGGKFVLLIDESASMQTEDAQVEGEDPMTRLDAAKEAAIALIESMKEPGVLGGQADEAMVISFSSEPSLRQSFTSDKRKLMDAVRAIEPTDRPSLLAPASKLVRSYAPKQLLIEDPPPGGEARPPAERPPGRVGEIHIYSDGRLADAAEAVFGPEDTIVYDAVGKPDTPNIGITSLRASRDFTRPDRLSVYVGLSSTARQRTTVDLELLVDNVVTEIKSITVPAAEPPAVRGDETSGAEQRWEPATGGTVFDLEQPSGVVVTVRLRAPDGDAPDPMPVDDVAWLVVPPAKQLAVAVVTRGNLFIADAARGLPLSKLDVMSPEQYDGLVASGGAGEYDVIVLDGHLPEAPPEAAVGLPPGRFLIFGAVPQAQTGLIDEGKREQMGQIIDWSLSHPVMRGLALENVYLYKPRVATLPEDSLAQVIATAAVGTDSIPAVIELATGDTRAIVVPSSAIESNWGFELSWVLFIGQTIRYLGDIGESGIGQSVRPGEPISDRLPLGVSSATMRTPQGQTLKVTPAPDGSFNFGPINETGVYTLAWTGEAREGDTQSGSSNIRAYAANLVDRAESDVGASGLLRTQQVDATAEPSGGKTKAPKNLWPWLIVAALAIIMLEWFIYNRKVYV